MKTFLECLDEAAAITEAHHIIAYIKLSLDEIHLVMLQAAADIYSTQSNSHKPVVGGPASDGAKEGEQLGNEAQVQSGRVGCVHNTLRYIGPWYSCETCGTHFNARAEVPPEAALPF